MLSLLYGPALTSIHDYWKNYDFDYTEGNKKRWQEYTEELYKKDLHDPDNQDGVITRLEPDILECEVKWALGSITVNKANGGDGIPAELFQILKEDAVKVPGKYHGQRSLASSSPWGHNSWTQLSN